MKSEGSVEAPTRHPIDWRNPDFTDKASLDAEMERQFDVCHGCRRCFNLCGSFPTLFDLIDDSKTGELDSVNVENYAKVADDCTLCDMCYLTKCPYVPPHPFNIDFPHLMLRYKAYQNEQGSVPFIKKQLAEVDRNAKIVRPIAAVVNATNQEGSPLRPLLQTITTIDSRASIPKFAAKTLVNQVKDTPISINPEGVAFGEKAVLYATCYGNYNETNLGLFALKILAHFGVEARLEYPGCCGMPHLESGKLDRASENGIRISAFFEPMIDQGYTVISLIPSCALMMKSEWPLLNPNSASIQKLKSHTQDISEYIVGLMNRYGTPPSLISTNQDVTLHLACHARAQNMGAKAAQMLNYIPEIKVNTIERCSGHGGSWGMMKDNFDKALKIGRPVAKQIANDQNPNFTPIYASECPLAGEHIRQGVERLQNEKNEITPTKMHPLEIFAKALQIV